MNPRLKLLVLEDDPADALLIGRHLARHGLEAGLHRVADPGHLDAALELEWDLALVDCHLPGLEPRAALARIRARRPELPVILVSNMVGEETVVDLLDAGARDYVRKGSLIRLVPAIRRALEDAHERAARRRAEAALAQARAQVERRAAELEAVLQAVPAAVFIAHDADCRSITGNRTATEWAQLPEDAECSLTAPPAQRPGHIRVYQHGRELVGDALPMQQAARGEPVRDCEFQLVLADGSARTLFGNATPLWDEPGRPRGAVGAFVDITERSGLKTRCARRTGARTASSPPWPTSCAARSPPSAPPWRCPRCRARPAPRRRAT